MRVEKGADLHIEELETQKKNLKSDSKDESVNKTAVDQPID